MNWKQTIGLIIGVGVIVALCFIVIFPALYDKGEPEKQLESQKAKKQVAETAAEDEDHSVLPKLKGVNWKTSPQAKKTVKKKTTKNAVTKKSAAAVKKTDTEPEVVTPAETAPEPLLELEEMTWYEQEGYVVVSGLVKNISDKSLPSVQAHVTFQGDGGWFISEDHSLIALNPIFPNQISPFQVTSRYYSEITNAIVDFRTFSGETIPSIKVEPVVTDEVTDGQGGAVENATEGEVDVQIQNGEPVSPAQ